MEYRVFSSELKVNNKGTTFFLNESDKQYSHALKHSLMEVVLVYKLPFYVLSREDKVWLHLKSEFASLKEVLEFTSETLNIKEIDALIIFEYLIDNNIVEVKEPCQINAKIFYQHFLELNSFYKSAYKGLDENLAASFDFKFKYNFVLLKKIDLEFYKKASYPVKYIIDIVFYFMQKFMRNVFIRNERVEGKFEGCQFSFVGFDDNANGDDFITLEKDYKVINECLKNIGNEANFDSIKTHIEGC